MKKLFIFILIGSLLSSCLIKNDSRFSGMEKNDFFKNISDNNFEYIYEFKGHSDNWAGNYIVYKLEGEEDHNSVLLIKYIGERPEPTGSIEYGYFSETENGHGNHPYHPTDEGVLNLGSSVSNGLQTDKDTLVNIEVTWDGQSESFKLST